MKSKLVPIVLVSFVAGMIAAPLLWNLDAPLPISSAVAAPADASSADSKAEPLISPTEARARDFYAPNSEKLGPDEMRVIACGSGMPMPRLKQAAACFLIELGNGEKLIFDMGTGSMERIYALGIPLDFIDKVFLIAF